MNTAYVSRSQIAFSAIQVVLAKQSSAPSLVPLFEQYRANALKPPAPKLVDTYLTAQLRDRNHATIFTAMEGGKPVGFIQLIKDIGATSLRPMIYIRDLFVTEDSRKQGVAKQLLEQAKQEANKNKAGLSLKTHVSNTAAQALYTSQGFIPVNDYIYYEWDPNTSKI
jgi:GNAT superfamily N-acetyltransferase